MPVDSGAIFIESHLITELNGIGLLMNGTKGRNAPCLNIVKPRSNLRHDLTLNNVWTKKSGNLVM